MQSTWYQCCKYLFLIPRVGQVPLLSPPVDTHAAKAIQNARNAAKFLTDCPLPTTSRENVQPEVSNAAKSATKFRIPTELSSKYPEPPPGYYRKKLDCLSGIQSFLDNEAKFPCPGLHKVIEIQGALEKTYYCSFCDSNINCNCIIPHLGGFKHQLNCMKYYRNDLHQKWSYKPKYHIEKKIIEILQEEERRNGKGLIRVEKDFRDIDNRSTRTEKTDFRDIPSSSTQFQDRDYFENYLANSLPDPSKSGYYCKLCDSHCNSEAMWNSHIIGKRHITNLKKTHGAAPSKCKYIRAESDVRPILFDIIEKENIYHSPIVGLSQIREIRKPEIKGVLFNCFLCGGCISSLEILNHILSSKHREKYLISINNLRMETLNGCLISESYKSSILEEICASVEAEEGWGTPEVFYAKK